MTDKEKRELKDGVISIFKRFNILDHTATIEGLRDDILRYINSLQEEPVSEDIEKEIDHAHKLFYEEVGWDSDEGARAYVADWFAYYFAKWQKEQDQSTIELAEDHAILAGMEKMKEQMMKDATEATVHIEAGNYPYIPQIELYDYDKDVPLAKEGDKYKVILIKEE